jgi:hypothetical protein
MFPLASALFSFSKRNREGLFWLLIVFLSVFSGFRYNVGIDFFTYVNMMQMAYSGAYLHFRELGVIFLINVIGDIDIVLRTLFLLYAFGTNFCIAKFIQRELPKGYWFMAIAIYICLPQFYLQTLNIARQYFAIAILFWSFEDFLSNRKLAFLIKFAIAFLFGHFSIIIMLPVILFCKKNMSFILKISFLVCMILMHKYLYLWLSVTNYGSYLDFIGVEGRTSLKMILLCGLLFSMCFLEKYYSAERGKRIFYFNLLFFTASVYLITFLDNGNLREIIARVAFYTLPCILAIIPSIVKKIKGNQKQLVKFTIAIFVFGYYSIHLLNNSIADMLVPYSFGLKVQ